MIDRERAASFVEAYGSELRASVLPFWLAHAPDREFGGHYSCLDRSGGVFDSDKFLWMQTRYLWTASHLVRHAAAAGLDSATVKALKQEARSAARFLSDHGRDSSGAWYFSVRRDGKPAIAPYNVFTDCFACMAFAEYANLEGEESGDAADVATETWRNVVKRLGSRTPKGAYQKQMAAARAFRPLNASMIRLNLAQVLLDSPVAQQIGVAELSSAGADAVRALLAYHIDFQNEVVRERVAMHPGDEDSMEGRLLNPGHSAETISFALRFLQTCPDEVCTAINGDYRAARTVDRLLGAAQTFTAADIAHALTVPLLWTLRRGWDERYGGIFYYLDVSDRPPDKLEWMMKLWWVHAESALAALRAFTATGSDLFLEHFDRIHTYAFSHFPDGDNGEWYGYLDRAGAVTSEAKGGKWKGMFHLPRALFEIESILKNL